MANQTPEILMKHPRWLYAIAILYTEDRARYSYQHRHQLVVFYSVCGRAWQLKRASTASYTCAWTAEYKCICHQAAGRSCQGLPGTHTHKYMAIAAWRFISWMQPRARP
ncbi:hypothetical protein H0G86_000869 [Trichoderma simmonsii]|uniref:Uncharacterized protein n=1 Tax=Trichoderma simmonsii TaxID=1491479 RepID=A0A8G0PBV3_9HYPO|nr:hypothetical protein H0G86_000869 [Trichoderma simmonsii]